MARYHINAQGNPGVCHAKKACPFGDMDSDHYSSKEDARSAYEVKMNETSEPYVPDNEVEALASYDAVTDKLKSARFFSPEERNTPGFVDKFAKALDKPSRRLYRQSSQEFREANRLQEIKDLEAKALNGGVTASEQERFQELQEKQETRKPEVKSGDYITDDFYDNIPVKVLEVRKGWSPDVKIPSWAGKTSASEYADQKVYVYENDMGNKAQTSEHATHPSGPPKTLEEQMLPGSPATADTVGRGTQVQRQVQGNDYDDMYATEQATVTRVRKRGGKPVGVNIEGEWSQGYYSFDELPKLWNKIDNQ